LKVVPPNTCTALQPVIPREGVESEPFALLNRVEEFTSDPEVIPREGVESKGVR
jgi:hypothetical protein